MKRRNTLSRILYYLEPMLLGWILAKSLFAIPNVTSTRDLVINILIIVVTLAVIVMGAINAALQDSTTTSGKLARRPAMPPAPESAQDDSEEN